MSCAPSCIALHEQREAPVPKLAQRVVEAAGDEKEEQHGRERAPAAPHNLLPQRTKFLGLGGTQVDLELLIRPDSLVAISLQIVALLCQCVALL
jgi:hypothetical protein